MNSVFFSSLTKFKNDAGKSRRDDDFSDRFNHNYSTLILVVFTLIISARQYIGKPITCWVPAELTRAQEEYAESVCWVTSTYFIPPSNPNIPINPQERYATKLHYYQWVPFVLMIQAFFFNVPYIIWRLLNWQSGMNLSGIMEVACDIELIKDLETRRANVMYVASHIEDSLAVKRDHKNSDQSCVLRCFGLLSKCFCVWFGKRQGNYLVVLYLITKFLYIINIIAQFVLMTRFIETPYTFYGLDILMDLAMGTTWKESGNFPRITMCDFDIRKLGNIHKTTVQCVLPINMFNEKIYVFLWFWFLIVSVICISSFLQWAMKSSFRATRIDFVRKFLRLRGLLEPGDRPRVFSFVDHYLRHDGVFILRLICTNVGEMVASEITERLWFIYIRHPLGQRRPQSSTSYGSNYQKLPSTAGNGKSKTKPKPGSRSHKSSSTQPKISQHPEKAKPTASSTTNRGGNVEEDPGEVV